MASQFCKCRLQTIYSHGMVQGQADPIPTTTKRSVHQNSPFFWVVNCSLPKETSAQIWCLGGGSCFIFTRGWPKPTLKFNIVQKMKCRPTKTRQNAFWNNPGKKWTRNGRPEHRVGSRGGGWGRRHGADAAARAPRGNTDRANTHDIWKMCEKHNPCVPIGIKPVSLTSPEHIFCRKKTGFMATITTWIHGNCPSSLFD